MDVVEQPGGLHIVMFVNRIQILVAAELPQRVVIAARMLGACRADDFDFGMVFFEGIGYHPKPGAKFGNVVFFVAQANVFQVERFGMAHLCPFFPPFG